MKEIISKGYLKYLIVSLLVLSLLFGIILQGTAHYLCVYQGSMDACRSCMYPACKATVVAAHRSK